MPELVVGGGSAVVFAVDAKGIFTLSEGPGLEGLGLKAGELVGRSAFDAYAGEPSVSENLSRALSGKAFDSVVEVKGATFECLYKPLRNAEGDVVGVVGVAARAAQDDGVGKNGASEANWNEAHALPGGFEEAMQSAPPEVSSSGGKGWLGRLVEGSPNLVIVTGPGGAVRYVNPAVERVLGYRAGEFADVPSGILGIASEIVHPDDLDRTVSELARAAAATGPMSGPVARVRRKDGSWRHLEWSASNLSEDPEVRGLLFVCRDVTERVRAEEEVRRLNERLEALVEKRTAHLRATVAELEENQLRLGESEERYRELVENVREGIGLIGIEGVIVEYCNGAYAEILGLSPKELVGRSFLDFVDEGQREEALRQGDLRLRGVGSTYELNVTSADGKRKVLSCGGYPVFCQDGTCRESVQTIVDVTKRKRMEQALLASEKRFRITFDRAAVGMAHVAPSGGWIRVNDKLSGIVGYSREELLALTFQDITHPDDLEADLRHVHRMLAGAISEYSIEKRYIRKDRSRVWIELTVSLVRDPEGEPDYFISVIEDITDRKLKELVPDPLTPREAEVLCRIAAGLNNPRIAKELVYSLGTVKLSVRRVLAKLGTKDRAAAAAKAVEIGLVPPPPP